MRPTWSTCYRRASGRYSRLREVAFNYAYVLSQYGLTSLDSTPPGAWTK